MVIHDKTIWHNLTTGRISVRPDGRVFGPRETELKPRINSMGQARVQLRGPDGVWRQVLVARIIYMAYNPAWEGDGQVIHIDGNSLNNHFRNLRSTGVWVDIPEFDPHDKPEMTLEEKQSALEELIQETKNENADY